MVSQVIHFARHSFLPPLNCLAFSVIDALNMLCGNPSLKLSDESKYLADTVGVCFFTLHGVDSAAANALPRPSVN